MVETGHLLSNPLPHHEGVQILFSQSLGGIGHGSALQAFLRRRCNTVTFETT